MSKWWHGTEKNNYNKKHKTRTKVVHKNVSQGNDKVKLMREKKYYEFVSS